MQKGSSSADSGVSHTPLTVLVAGSSPLISDWLVSIVSKVPGALVCEKAASQDELLSACWTAKPRLVLLDQGGKASNVAALQKMASWQPAPYILAISDTHATLSKRDMDTLLIGRGEIVDRPAEMEKTELQRVLWYKLCHLSMELPRTQVKPSNGRSSTSITLSDAIKAIGISISTGGPHILYEQLPQLAPSLGVPLLIAQHLPLGYSSDLCSSLDKICPLPVKGIEEGERLRPGTVYLGSARRDFALLREPDGVKLTLHRPLPDEPCHPSGDVLLNSLADVYGKHALGVVMTGIGNDGAKGLKRIHQMGGVTIAQEELSCSVYGMPKAALESGATQYEMTPSAIFKTINSLSKETS